MTVESQAQCVKISPGETYRGKQALEYFAGVSSESAGARALCMHIVTIAPGARARPHLHARHESAIYVLSGEAGTWFGEGLRQHVWVKAGDFLYIPANMPHLPYNPSDNVPCVGVVARTDPNEQESVTLLDLPDPGVAPR
jgi:uncharacterized RmlC-like cupin family protein